MERMGVSIDAIRQVSPQLSNATSHLDPGPDDSRPPSEYSGEIQEIGYRNPVLLRLRSKGKR